VVIVTIGYEGLIRKIECHKEVAVPFIVFAGSQSLHYVVISPIVAVISFTERRMRAQLVRNPATKNEFHRNN
jgi:hypothetical protein